MVKLKSRLRLDFNFSSPSARPYLIRQHCNKDPTFQILPNHQIIVIGLQQILDNFIVNLQITNTQHEFAFRSIGDMVEDVRDGEGGDSGLVRGSEHGVCFAR